MIDTQVRDDVAPKRAGHGQSMWQDDDRPGAAGVLVLDRSRRKFNLGHDSPSYEYGVPNHSYAECQPDPRVSATAVTAR
jgi:hypothetical protein